MGVSLATATQPAPAPLSVMSTRVHALADMGFRDRDVTDAYPATIDLATEAAAVGDTNASNWIRSNTAAFELRMTVSSNT